VNAGRRLLVAGAALASLAVVAPASAGVPGGGAGALIARHPAALRTVAGTAACPGRPPVLVPGHGRLQVFAMQYLDDIPAMASYPSIARYVDCYFRRYVAPYRDPAVPGLVVFNELTSLAFGVEGSLGLPARAFATTPAATAPGQRTGQPLGALGGAIGLVAATHLRQLAYYAATFPGATSAEALGDVSTVAAGGVRVPADRVFLALTDTYVRAIWDSFAAAARRYRVAVVVGAVLPVLNGTAACAGNGYRGWVACPGWRSSTSPTDLAALADPDLLPGESRVDVAVTPNVENVALVFGPDGRLDDLQPKVNLTPIELEIGWSEAPPTTLHAIALRDAAGRTVPGVRLGIAISLDAFEHADRPHPCTDRGSVVACLAAQGVNVLLQPEFNDGTPECASWSDYSTACGPPVWQQLGWMLSSFYDVESGRYPSLRYAVNPFMVGNLYDLTGDGQSAIFARDDPRATSAAYVGDLRPVDRYPDPVGLAALEGPQPGFLAVAPWVLAGRVRDDPALAPGDPRSLESCEDGLVPGSGVHTGTCRENGYLVTALVAELRLP